MDIIRSYWRTKINNLIEFLNRCSKMKCRPNWAQSIPSLKKVFYPLNTIFKIHWSLKSLLKNTNIQMELFLDLVDGFILMARILGRDVESWDIFHYNRDGKFSGCVQGFRKKCQETTYILRVRTSSSSKKRYF